MSFDTLTNWFRDNGGYISTELSIKEIAPGNIGVISSTTSDSDQIKLPEKLIITSHTAEQYFGSKFTKKNLLLKLYLAKARSEEVFYLPYLNLLPTLEQINVPFIWSPQDQALLKGSNLGNSLRGHLTQIVEEWFSAISAIPENIPKPEQHYTNIKFYYEYKFYKEDDLFEYLRNSEMSNWTGFPAFLWASSILKSRSFPAYLMKDLFTGVETDDLMLLPVVDLLNHNPQSKVHWNAKDGQFCFKCDNNVAGSELFNNYGMKGNEELLLGYGFTLADNSADTAALKIKVPSEIRENMKKEGISLPKMSDYTFSVVDKNDKEENDQESDGLLFFVSATNIPEELIEVFLFLVKNSWDKNHRALRPQFAGLNYLRQAMEQKQNIINVPENNGLSAASNAYNYLSLQKKIFAAAVKTLKRKEKEMISTHKENLLTLKSVYKNDVPLQRGLLVGFGCMNWDAVTEMQIQDQVWLLYLMRCANRSQLETEDLYLPEWIEKLFVEMKKLPVSNEEILLYKAVYQTLIPPLVESVPEVFGRGSWTVEDLIASARLLDAISFVRGKEQECIVVENNN